MHADAFVVQLLEEKWTRMLFLDALGGFFFRHFLSTLSTYREDFEKPDCRSQIRKSSRSKV